MQTTAQFKTKTQQSFGAELFKNLESSSPKKAKELFAGIKPPKRAKGKEPRRKLARTLKLALKDDELQFELNYVAEHKDLSHTDFSEAVLCVRGIEDSTDLEFEAILLF